MNTEKEEYKISNFHVAAWLMMNDFPLKEIKWSNDNRAEFVFDDFSDREAFVSSFFNQDQLQSYISTSQKLKNMMYATRAPKVYDNN